ncbi:MAG: NADH-quinone oxidoreductase subunit N [Bacteroidota bacterium]
MDINDQLTWLTQSVWFLLPEGWLCMMIVVLVVSSFFKKIHPSMFFGVTLGSLVALLPLLYIQWPSQPITLFVGSLRSDDYASFFKTLFALGALLTLLIDHRQDRPAEYFILLMFALLGTFFLVMSMDFVSVTLSLELISIPSYVLATGLTNTKRQAEAAWKYFIFGSTATAVMIFGMSYLFGLSGSLQFSSQTFAEQLLQQKTPLLLVGGVLALAGFLFKTAAVPFHLWAPDVYEAAPTPVVAFFSVVPKLAGVAVFTRLVLALNLFGQSQIDWALVISVIALASLLIGTLGALTQTDAKRMMAYSSIAQTGFLFAAIATLSPDGVHMAMYYGAVLMVMNFLTFHVLIQAETQVGTTITSFSGWGTRFLLPALGILVGLISLTGLPPTAGFMAKFFVFSALWERFSSTGSTYFAVLFSVGLLATVASLFFYLKIPYYSFLKKPAETVSEQKIGVLANLLTVILVIVLLYLFFIPGALMGVVNKVNFVL